MDSERFLQRIGQWVRGDLPPCPDVADRVIYALREAAMVEDEWFTLACFGSATTLAAACSVFIALHNWQSSADGLGRLVVSMMGGGF